MGNPTAHAFLLIVVFILCGIIAIPYEFLKNKAEGIAKELILFISALSLLLTTVFSKEDQDF